MSDWSRELDVLIRADLARYAHAQAHENSARRPRVRTQRIALQAGSVIKKRASRVRDERIARTDRAMLALRPPDICDQVRAAAADGFKAVPPATSRFLRLAAIAFPDSDSLPSTAELLSMMRSFITPSERPAITHLHNLERRLDRLNGLFGLHAWVRMPEAALARRLRCRDPVALVRSASNVVTLVSPLAGVRL